MRGLYQVTIPQAQELAPPKDWVHIEKIAVLTNPLLAGIWDDQLICLVGLIPRSFMSDWAYLWLYDTPVVASHKLIVGRYAKLLIAYWRKTYHLEGHCLTDSWRWLKSLGAVQTSQITFEIPKWQHH